jgi:hypothetical protein
LFAKQPDSALIVQYHSLIVADLSVEQSAAPDVVGRFSGQPRPSSPESLPIDKMVDNADQRWTATHFAGAAPPNRHALYPLAAWVGSVGIEPTTEGL